MCRSTSSRNARSSPASTNDFNSDESSIPHLSKENIAAARGARQKSSGGRGSRRAESCSGAARQERPPTRRINCPLDRARTDNFPRFLSHFQSAGNYSSETRERGVRECGLMGLVKFGQRFEGDGH